MKLSLSFFKQLKIMTQNMQESQTAAAVVLKSTSAISQ